MKMATSPLCGKAYPLLAQHTPLHAESLGPFFFGSLKELRNTKPQEHQHFHQPPSSSPGSQLWLETLRQSASASHAVLSVSGQSWAEMSLAPMGPRRGLTFSGILFCPVGCWLLNRTLLSADCLR